MSKWENSLDISKINKKEYEFIDDLYLKIDQKWNLPLKKISKDYNVGMSFLYNLISKLGFHSWRDFIYTLNHMSRQLEDKYILIKLDNDLRTKITMLIEDINTKNIYLVGQGYSFIALHEIYYFLSKFETNIQLINISLNDYQNNIYDVDQSTFIFYSFKGKNLKIKEILSHISNKKNKIYIFTANSKNIYSEYANLIYNIKLRDKVLKEELELLSPVIIYSSINYWFKKQYLIKNQIEIEKIKGKFF